MNRVVKKLGVIVGVDGDISQVGMYHLSNDAEYLRVSLSALVVLCISVMIPTRRTRSPGVPASAGDVAPRTPTAAQAAAPIPIFKMSRRTNSLLMAFLLSDIAISQRHGAFCF